MTVKILRGGPFHGQRLELPETGGTFEFTSKGQTGFYWHDTWNETPKRGAELAKSMGYPVQVEPSSVIDQP
jgi:hypothetical protein